MQLQGKTAVWVLGFTLVSNAHAGCFDFSKLITEPLRPPVTTDQSGTLPQGWLWGAIRGTANQPITAVIKDLEDHRSTKSPRVNKMELTDLKDGRYLLKQQAKMEVDPFPFVKVKWTEIWAFALDGGTKESPNRVVVSYEKTEGTSHIEHLCGNYVLQKLPGNKTDVFMYEEVKATNRTEKEEIQGLKGSLGALSQLKTQ